MATTRDHSGANSRWRSGLMGVSPPGSTANDVSGRHGTRVILADDDPNVRSALRLLLEERLNLCVVADAIDFPALIEAVSRTNSDLVLIDWQLLQIPVDCEAVYAWRQMPNIQVVELSGRPEDRVCA